MKAGKANLSITRTSGGACEPVIKFILEDDGEAVTFEMTPHDFAMATTGLSHVDVQIVKVRNKKGHLDETKGTTPAT